MGVSYSSLLPRGNTPAPANSPGHCVALGPLDFVVSEGGALVGVVVRAERAPPSRSSEDDPPRVESPRAAAAWQLLRAPGHSRPPRDAVLASVRILLAEAALREEDVRALRSYIPPGMLDADFLYETQLPMNRLLAFAPPELFSRSMLREALEREGMCLSLVPEERRDADLCHVAVCEDGVALAHVPEALRSRTLCRRAVSQNGASLAHVPEPLLHVDDYELPRLAALSWPEAMRFIPVEGRTRTLCLDLLRVAPRCLAHVPTHFLTRDLMEDLVRRERGCVADAPRDLLDEDLCVASVSAPEPSLPSVYAEAARNLARVPREWRTLRVCRAALRSQSLGGGCADALPHVPVEFLDEVSCVALVTENWECLRHLPACARTLAVCLAAVGQSAMALPHCPERMRSREVCRIALQTGAISGSGACLAVLSAVPDAVLMPLPDEEVGALFSPGEEDGWSIARLALSANPAFAPALVERAARRGLRPPADALFEALARDPEVAHSAAFYAAAMLLRTECGGAQRPVA